MVLTCSSILMYEMDLQREVLILESMLTRGVKVKVIKQIILSVNLRLIDTILSGICGPEIKGMPIIVNFCIVIPSRVVEDNVFRIGSIDSWVDVDRGLVPSGLAKAVRLTEKVPP